MMVLGQHKGLMAVAAAAGLLGGLLLSGCATHETVVTPATNSAVTASTGVNSCQAQAPAAPAPAPAAAQTVTTTTTTAPPRHENVVIDVYHGIGHILALPFRIVASIIETIL